MKIKVIVDEKITESEVLITCNKITPDILKVQEIVSNMIASKVKLIFYKNNQEYYLNLDDILFFETTGTSLYAHTIKNVYEVKYRLYELEKLLPFQFMRVSKSTILNVEQIFSLNRNITSSSLVEFYNTHKQVYVSRKYLKNLHDKIKEERYHEKNE